MAIHGPDRGHWGPCAMQPGDYLRFPTKQLPSLLRIIQQLRMFCQALVHQKCMGIGAQFET
jgi:hypothetical protein